MSPFFYYSGVIDAGYQGEIKVIIINNSKTQMQITKKMKIAQLLILPIIVKNCAIVKKFGKTDRNVSGFGSTGIF